MEDLILAGAFILMSFAARAAGAAPEPRTFPADGIKEIIVETGSGEIALTVSEGKSVATAVSPAPKPDDECEITQELKGTTLTLRARAVQSGVFSVNKSCSAGFSVKAPARVAVTVRSGSGGVRLGAFSGASEVKTGSGDIGVNGPSGALSLRSGSGGISGETSSRELDASTGSGDVNLRGLTGPASVKSGSGSISLAWSVAPKKGAIEVRTGSGDFKATFPKDTKLNASLVTASGSVDNEFGSDSAAALTVNFRSGSGNVALKKSTR